METRQRTRRVQVADSDVAVGTGVYAPSRVATRSKAAESAAVLSGALGFGAETFASQVKVKQDKDAEAGALAAMRAEFTDEELHTMEKSAAFVQGAQRVFAKQRIIEDSAAATEWYQTQFDKGAGLDELRAGLNEFWRSRYEGVSTGIAREIAPLMAQASDNIMASHAKFQAETTQQELTTAQGTVIDNALRSGTYDHETIRAESNALIGKEKTNALLTERWIAHAAAMADETVLDDPALKMLWQNRQFAPDLQKARADIRTARIEAAEQASFATQGALQAGIGRYADNGDPRFWQALERGTQVDENGIQVVETDAEVEAYITRFYRSQESAHVGSVNTNLWATGNGRAMASNSERDAAAVSHAEQVAARAEKQGHSPEDAAALGRAALIDRAVVNNYLPTRLRNEIEVSPQHAEAWTNGYDLYTQLKGREASEQAMKQIDSDTIRAYQMYERMLRESGDPERARESVAASDFSLWRNVEEKQRRSLEDAVVDSLRDGILFGDNDIADTNRLRTMVKEDLEYYVTKGMQPEQAAEMAVNNLHPKSGRYAVVDGHLYRSNEGWNEHADAAARAAKVAYALQNEVRSWYGTLQPEDVNILPVPNKPGFVYLTGPGPLARLGSTNEVPISMINDGYDQFNIEAARTQQEKRDDGDVKAVMNELYPLPTGGNGTDFGTGAASAARLSYARQEQERRWNALTPEQQDALIERHRRDERDRKAARDAANRRVIESNRRY